MSQKIKFNDTTQMFEEHLEDIPENFDEEKQGTNTVILDEQFLKNLNRDSIKRTNTIS